MKKATILRLFAALLAAAMLPFGGASCGASQPTEQPDDKQPSTEPSNAALKIMTFNVLNGWNTANIGTRDDLTAEKILALMPDVVGLQEFDDYYRNAMGTTLAEMLSEHYAEAGVEALSWNPIFYNASTLELVQCGHEDYAVGTSYDTYVYQGQKGSRFRTIAWALFQHKASGQRFLVCNTHFDVKEEKIPPQVAQLQSRVTELRNELGVSTVLLMGDLNSNTSSAPAQSLFDYGFQDTHELAQTKDNSHSCGKLGEPITGTYRGAIDHVYCIGERIAVASYVTVTDMRDASDHCPVVVELELNESKKGAD